MPDYSSLAALRGALTEDSPDERAEAYGSVLNADVQPSQVLESDPDTAVLDDLRAAGVIPQPDETANTNAAEQRQRMVELLEQVAANTGGA